MKKLVLCLPAALTLLLSGCKNDNDNDVIAQRFYHIHGHPMAKEEWTEKKCPSQVITTLRNGVTITATYENGVLHGPCTHTHPHSQTVEYFYLYGQGDLLKETTYDVKGMPLRERVQISPSRHSLTCWYQDGAPMSVEDYTGEELLEGEYFTVLNETESRVDRGSGIRITRNAQGNLLSKDYVAKGYMVKKETFYPGGMPESISMYAMNKLHGERKVFSQTGEPLAIEEWVNGELHGKGIYFTNGAKQMEVSYLFGSRNGLETHFVDGKNVSLEISWENDKKHGPTTFYVGGLSRTEWYYDNQKVSKKKFDELNSFDEMVSKLSNEVPSDSSR